MIECEYIFFFYNKYCVNVNVFVEKEIDDVVKFLDLL